MRHRLIFCLALAGLLITAHLHALKQRGFDRGCLGIGEPAAREAVVSLPCAEVSAHPAGRILGVEVTVPGFLFYAAAAAASHLAATGSARAAATAARLLTFLLPAGLVFSAWLTLVQRFGVGAFCPLCLASALAVLLMNAARFLPGPRTAADAAPPAHDDPVRVARETAFLSLAAFVFAAALAFDLVFVLDAGSGEPRREAVERIALETVPQLIDRKWLAQMAPCSFRESEPPRADFRGLLPPGVAAKGPAGAPVVVQEFFDPHCPKCAELFRALESVAARLGDRVRIEYYPLPLAARSELPVAAMLLAHETAGMLPAMASMIFSRTAEAAFTASELADLAGRLGLPREPFAAGLADPSLLDAARARRDFYRSQGWRAAPTLLVNGRALERSAGALTAECLDMLIGQTLAETGAPLEDEE